jgi:hypothetical protein
MLPSAFTLHQLLLIGVPRTPPRQWASRFGVPRIELKGALALLAQKKHVRALQQHERLVGEIMPQRDDSEYHIGLPSCASRWL